MEVIVDAVYEDGVLKPKRRLKIPEGSEVRVKIIPQSISERTFGVVKLSKKEIDRIIKELEDEW
ncbi:antitoxin AF2212-like protein [Thermococcus sp.]|uniref:antitoxin family protein n=1 Tax=Thermococcus sp. TaxID=35749 RepID=UPI00261B32C3|nr:antitoxin AF2212-like protein [Thermococcus sp.]